MPLRADRLPAIAGAHRVRGVLDQRHAMLLRDLTQPGKITGSTGVVHRDDCLGARSDGRRRRLRRHHQGVAVDIDEDRCGAEQADQVGRGNPGQRRRDDFVSGSDPQRQQGHVHGRGGRTQGYRVSRSDEGGEPLFQLLVSGSGRDPSGAQDPGDRFNFGIADAGQGKRQKWQFHRSGPLSARSCLMRVSAWKLLLDLRYRSLIMIDSIATLKASLSVACSTVRHDERSCSTVIFLAWSGPVQRERRARARPL